MLFFSLAQCWVVSVQVLVGTKIGEGEGRGRKGNYTIWKYWKFSSVQDGNYAFGKAHMRSTPSLRSFPSVAFETVPMFVWLMMALSRPFKEDCLALSLSTPLSSRQFIVWCPWLCTCIVLEVLEVLPGYDWLLNGCYLTKRFFLLLLRLTLAWKISAAVLPIPASECVSAVFSCVQMTVLPDIGIFNMHVDVGVCDCTQGLYGHHKSLHWKLTLGYITVLSVTGSYICVLWDSHYMGMHLSALFRC